MEVHSLCCIVLWVLTYVLSFFHHRSTGQCRSTPWRPPAPVLIPAQPLATTDFFVSMAWPLPGRHVTASTQHAVLSDFFPSAVGI